MLTDDRISSVPTSVPVKQTTGTTAGPKTALLISYTGTTIENNVFTPLHSNKSVKRIVGVKGRSGITKPIS